MCFDYSTVSNRLRYCDVTFTCLHICVLILYYSHFVKEVEKRGLQVAVAGIPKTIDNDIAVSFLTVLYNDGLLNYAG